MNKKLINGLLLLAVATSGASVFTSCKDNEDATLAGIYDNESELINALQKKLADLLKDTDDKLALKLDEATYNAFKNGEWATLWEAVKGTNGLEKKFEDLYKQINDPDGLLKRFNDLSVDYQRHLVEYAETKLAVTKLQEKVKALENSGYLNQADRDEIMKLINDNGTSIAALKSYMDSKLAAMVTSIQVQRVYNNMYGSLDLPMGINSTVLGSYYYEAKEAVTFPNTDLTEFQKGEYKETNPDLLDGIRAWEEGVTPGNVQNLPANEKKIESLGKIYLTVNPVGPDFSGLTVELKSSKEHEPVKATLQLVEEGDDDAEFKFGTGTRAKNNGLYVIEVPASVEDIENIEVKVDEGLKSAVKDLYNSPSKADLTSVAQGVYNTLINTNLPAYAVKLGYVSNPMDLATALLTVKGATLGADGVVRDANGDIVYGGTTTHSWNAYTGVVPSTSVTYNYLYSKYDIAAVTFHPLSFGTGVDLSFDRELPTFGRIKDAINDYFDKIKDKVNIKIEPTPGTSWTVSFDESKFQVNIDNITIDLTGVPVYNEHGDPIGTVGNDANPVIIVLDKDGKTGEINGVRYASIKQLVDAIQAPMSEVESVIAQVNDIVADIQKQVSSVNNQVKDIISDIQDDLNKKLDTNNDLVKLYNKVVDKVNGFLKDPNQYLQVYAAYKDNNGNLHHFSTDVNDPSLYTKANEGFTVYLTSYNGELLVPAYKKIVTVSNVYQNGVEVANAKTLLEKANSGDDINTVIDGDRHKVALTTLEKGYTYEIFYSALDYRGVTSSRKYYIEVK